VVAGRSTVQNVSKYVLMGSSSNFGNMFSMAGAALFLPFLPMLPIQILLNNLLYDVSEIAIPFDEVDQEAIAAPVKWDIKFIERFMLVFGPVSSIFDFITFYALLHLFGAGEALFRTGWFIESITTQVLVVFAIRTRRQFFRSRPHKFLIAMALGAVAVAIVLPFVPTCRGGSDMFTVRRCLSHCAALASLCFGVAVPAGQPGRLFRPCAATVRRFSASGPCRHPVLVLWACKRHFLRLLERHISSPIEA
jgi:magnesium-transporting ATPase (P-type)